MTTNVAATELAKFDALAERWWDPHGEFKTLHDINPLRLALVADRVSLAGSRVADVGCGGGLLAEAMAGAGAAVTGIDLSERAIAIARLHAEQAGLALAYRVCSAEALQAESAATFDVVTCMELLEHVPDPAALVANCAALLQPGGSVFFSTLNRTVSAYAQAVVGAEYLLRLLPRGTHDYARFIRPSELATWARTAGLEVRDVVGLSYNPFSGQARLSPRVQVNYFLVCVKPAGPRETR